MEWPRRLVDLMKTATAVSTTADGKDLCATRSVAGCSLSKPAAWTHSCLFPLVLGHGKRVCAEGTVPSSLRLTASTTFPNGALHLGYEPARMVAESNLAHESSDALPPPGFLDM